MNDYIKCNIRIKIHRSGIVTLEFRKDGDVIATKQVQGYNPGDDIEITNVAVAVDGIEEDGEVSVKELLKD